jgi:hypothetical protein
LFGPLLLILCVSIVVFYSAGTFRPILPLLDAYQLAINHYPDFIGFTIYSIRIYTTPCNVVPFRELSPLIQTPLSLPYLIMMPSTRTLEALISRSIFSLLSTAPYSLVFSLYSASITNLPSPSTPSEAVASLNNSIDAIKANICFL